MRSLTVLRCYAASIGSYRRFGLISKGQAVQEMPVPANRRCITSQKGEYLMYTAEEA